MLIYFVAIALFVAVLVFISSRIRRAANRAFEREVVRTQEFTIVKPEDFLSPVDTKFAFEAYTRDFGKGNAGNLRQAHAVVRVLSDLNEVEKSAVRSNFLSEEEKIEDEVSLKIFRKVFKSENNGKFYELQITALKDFEGDYVGQINEMLESFRAENSNIE